MDKVKVFHYGCSFTQNTAALDYDSPEIFQDFEYKNYGKTSSGNSDIFNKFKNTSEKNSTCIIQWSSLTRPLEDTYSLLEISNNPLYDLLEQWYSILDKTQQIAKEKNINLIQYIGWAQWKDSELNEYHREKLKSYNILWFYSKKTLDCISANCFQLQNTHEWSSNKRLDGLFQWPELKWGGMAEWIRENIEIDKRYIGFVNKYAPDFYDSHPSYYANKEFITKILIPILYEKNK